MDFRDDDLRDEGICPKCGRSLVDLTDEAKGFCEEHGWVFANWMSPNPRKPDDKEREE